MSLELQLQQNIVDPKLHLEISQFYHQEAYFLDHRMYKEWFDLLTDDVKYRMPLRVTKERRDGSDIVDEMTYFEETKKSLETRVQRLYTNSAWVDDPPTRQRHYITNIMITPSAVSDEYNVRTYFFYKRSRASELQTEEIMGEREDVIRKEEGKWKISQRTIYPDQTVLTVMNLGMFL
ncbi:3-phenylpropionate/cinnamic acid dioxygenase subunit beta [Neobacillus mesonae]|uniref:3-phenylpropionate/cinnamic acid dioxygenase subunit beta n=1 Tax=Neobacillus mesonae TaxID=1193713 RepID=UPI000A4EDCAF|nr:3-phenylpropionate/cinnamic acid dioxygenase subunit beta [Neobacillus mesonae]